MSQREEVIYWHRRYYGPATIGQLLGLPIHDVQLIIYAYESHGWKGMTT